MHFKKYLEPVLNGEAKETDSKILWRHIKPHLRKCLYTSQVEEFAMSRHQMQSVSTQIQLHYKHSNIELPSYAKYLVIAAYLASYNPAKMDSRFFVKVIN